MNEHLFDFWLVRVWLNDAHYDKYFKTEERAKAEYNSLKEKKRVVAMFGEIFEENEGE